jgi:hypothetical protein
VFYETMPQYLAFQYVATHLRSRLYEARGDDRGMTTETVLITAILAAAAIGVGFIILNAVTKKGGDVGSTITNCTPVSGGKC